MQDRSSLLSAKTVEIQKQLENWATREKILGPGEQIHFSITIAKIPTAISTEKQDALLLNIKELLNKKRCDSLGINEHMQAILRSRLGRGKIDLDYSWNHDSQEVHEFRTIADILKFSGKDLLRIKNFGKKGVEALQKLLKSISIEWE